MTTGMPASLPQHRRPAWPVARATGQCGTLENLHECLPFRRLASQPSPEPAVMTMRGTTPANLFFSHSLASVSFSSSVIADSIASDEASLVNLRGTRDCSILLIFYDLSML